MSALPCLPLSLSGALLRAMESPVIPVPLCFPRRDSLPTSSTTVQPPQSGSSAALSLVSFTRPAVSFPPVLPGLVHIPPAGLCPALGGHCPDTVGARSIRPGPGPSHVHPPYPVWTVCCRLTSGALLQSRGWVASGKTPAVEPVCSLLRFWNLVSCLSPFLLQEASCREPWSACLSRHAVWGAESQGSALCADHHCPGPSACRP